MPKLNLQPEHLVQVKNILKQWAPHAEIWAYGSRVNGNCHESSDLDLVVRHTDELQTPYKQLMDLKQAFSESDLPIMVDLIDWTYLPDNYRVEIKKKYVVLQSKSSS